ncbi:MAG: VOC family protein [Burkholderiales bacterium]
MAKVPSAVPPVPPGYHSVTPYLVLEGAAKAIEFYQQAFDAEELMRLPTPDGKVAHAEIRIGDSPVMLADATDEFKGPRAFGGTPVSLMVYVEDVDRVFRQALAAGATEMRPVVDQFYGDRTGTLTDPFGHVWTIATHVEDVSPEEIDRRMAMMMQGGQ